MAIQWMDDFDSYGETESFLLDGLYAEASNVTLTDSPDPNESVTVLRFPNQNFNRLRRVLSSNQTTVGVAFRMWPDELPSGFLPDFIRFRDEDNSTNVTITLTTTGAISAYRGSRSSGTLLGTSDPVIVAGAFQHVEVKVVFDNSAGSVEVRVEGVTVLDLSGIDTVATTKAHCAQVYFAGTRDASNEDAVAWHIKDLVAWDGSGSSNNDFLGSVSVIRLIPDGDSSFNWTASTGSTGYDLIDEDPPNDDTDYIYADDTPPAASTFTLTNLPEDVTSVRGIQIQHRSRKTDGGDGNVQAGVVSNGTTGNGADRAITTSYTYWFDILDTDPDTGVAFTPAAIDALLLRLDRTL